MYIEDWPNELVICVIENPFDDDILPEMADQFATAMLLVST
jgi:hypothetical protein